MRWIKVAVATALVLAGMGLTPERAAASDQTVFIASLVKAAQENERATGIPSSVAIGMAALETGWGRSKMASTYVVDAGLPTQQSYRVNTLFNIKCTSTASPYQTGCVPVRTAEYRSDGTRYFVVDKFRTYSSWRNSLLDYGRLLSTSSRYSKAFSYKAYPDQFVTEIRKGGYATDPKYAELVISIMKRYNLYQYNLNKAGSGFPPAASAPAAAAAASSVAVVNPPQYQSGSKSSGVATLQRLLNANGASLSADGIFGAKTKKALEAYQKRVGVKATGVADVSTWRKLLPTLSAGAKGASVKALQTELTAAGYRVSATGNYLSATTQAVKNFQKANKLAVTGKADLSTWALLLKK